MLLVEGGMHLSIKKSIDKSKEDYGVLCPQCGTLLYQNISWRVLRSTIILKTTVASIPIVSYDFIIKLRAFNLGTVCRMS